VAHDNKKADLIEWARFNRDTLAAHHLCATGTTGSIIENELKLEIVKLQSRPLGGDQQIGAMISRGELDLLIFFLGCARDPASRSRRQSIVANDGRVEHPRGVQSQYGRFHDRLAADVREIRPGWCRITPSVNEQAPAPLGLSDKFHGCQCGMGLAKEASRTVGNAAGLRHFACNSPSPYLPV
jgi:hypothetical protein